MAKGDKKEDLIGLVEVEVPASGDALANAVEQGKAVSVGETDVSAAKEVVSISGTTVVRW